jgi:hypothetical protein
VTDDDWAPNRAARTSLSSRNDILVIEDAVEGRLGALSPLLAGALKPDDEVSTPRGIHVEKSVEGRPEGFVPFGPERERDVVVGDLGFRVPPGEPQEVMGGHPFGAEVGWVFETKKGPPIVTVPERPAGHLLESDRVGAPSGWVAGPGEEHAAVRDHYALPLDSKHCFTGHEQGAQECCNLGVTPVRPLGDASFPRALRIHWLSICMPGSARVSTPRPSMSLSMESDTPARLSSVRQSNWLHRSEGSLGEGV